MSAAVQAAWAQLAIQRRRARWFEYVRRRFDMVSLSMVADWCAREPGGVVRNEGRREQAYRDLYQSILEGEFGSGEWPAVAHMPTPVPTYSPFCLRRSLFQIQRFMREGYNPLVDLWAPRTAVVEWFTRRGIGLPPALRLDVRSPSPAPPGAAVGEAAATAPSKYSDAALGAWFMFRVRTWQDGVPFPSEKKDMADAKAAFGTIPRLKFRAIRAAKTPKEWQKQGKRGAR